MFHFTQASAVTLCMEEKGHRFPAPQLQQSTPKAGAHLVQTGRRVSPGGRTGTGCSLLGTHPKRHTDTHKMDPQSHTTAQSQAPTLPSSTQPQMHQSRGIHSKAVTDTRGHTPQKNHAALGSQTWPNTRHHNESHRTSARATPGPRQTSTRSAAPRHGRHTHVCPDSHRQRETHPPATRHPRPAPATHTQTQSQGFISRPHTCTAAHTSPDWGLEGPTGEGPSRPPAHPPPRIPLPGPTSPPATAWSRSRRRNPPRASWKLSPTRGCHTRTLGLGAPGVNRHRRGAGRWAGGQWKGEPRRGLGRPSRAGGSLPLRAPLPVAALVTWSASLWPRWGPRRRQLEAAGDPCPWGGVQGEGPGRTLQRLWLRVSACVCVCVRVRAHCSTGRLHAMSGGAWGGGALKGHRSPWASARTQEGRMDRQGDTPPREDGPSPCTHPETKTHTQGLHTLTDTRTL